jgi:predicted RNA-binding protein Jag
MKTKFEDYVTTIISATFGFTPKVEILELPNLVIQCTLDGSDVERAEMMGKEAKNFQALKMLLRCFARRNGRFSFLYILPPKGVYVKNYKSNETNSSSHS